TGRTVLSGVRDRLFDRLSHGVRCDGGARSSRARRWQLARADLARADRPLARRTRRGTGSQPHRRAEGIHGRRAGALDDRQRHAGGSARSSRTGGAPVRNAAALGAALRAPPIPPARVARPRRLAPATTEPPTT